MKTKSAFEIIHFKWLCIAVMGWLCAGVAGQTVDTIISSDLSEPYGIAVDAGNIYYITDSANNRIVTFNPGTGKLAVLAGGAAGAVDAERGSDARFYDPQGIVAVADGVVVADTGNHLIRHVSFTGKVTTLAGDILGAQLSHDNGVNPDNFGFRDGPAAGAQFHSPYGITADVDGTIYIADTLNDAIRKLTTDGEVTTIARELSTPEGIAVGSDRTIYVADRGTHSIRYFKEPGSPQLLAGGGTIFDGGYKDSANALDALFKNPRGLFLNEAKRELLVADTGNSLVRRVYGLGGASGVDTYGNTATAGLNAPVGLAKDATGVILIADVGNNNVRGIRTSQTIQPPVSAPLIGSVVITNFSCGTRLIAATNSTFNNDIVLAIQAERDTVTFYTYGSTTNFDNIPDPRPDNDSPPAYSDCQDNFPENLLGRINPRIPQLTIKAYSTQKDRRPSPVAVANFVFQTANPVIIGSPASFQLDTITTNATIYYVTSDNETTLPDPGPGVPGARQYSAGQVLNIFQGEKVYFKARAFRDGYLPSAVVKRAFTASDVQFNYVGVSRDFEAGAGASLVLPIEVTLTTSNVLRSLQLRVETSPAQSGAPAPSLAVLPFSSNDFFIVKGPRVAPTTTLTYKAGTSGEINGMALVYSASPTFVMNESATLALLRVDLPKTARDGDSFLVRVVSPSGTSDGQQNAIPLLPLAAAAIHIQSGTSYVVGDTAIATGYNAKDFGDGTLQNNDFNNVFYAALGVRVPYRFSDLFNAMDAFPLDHDGVAGGDGQIRFLDYQYILARTLGIDSSKWVRFRSPEGELVSSGTGTAHALARQSAGSVDSHIVWNRPVLLGARTIGFAIPSLRVQVPVYVKIKDGASLSGMYFLASINGGGSAPAAQDVVFSPAVGVAPPSNTGLTGNAVYASWNIGAFQPSLSGNVTIGEIDFTVPATAVPGSSYTITFDKADGSPDLNTQYDFDTIHGFVAVDAPAPPAPVLPDEWLAHFFPNAGDPNADAPADPDGDGASNLVEYRTGSDPNRNDFNLLTALNQTSESLDLSWFGHAGLQYQVEGATSLSLRDWKAIGAPVQGNARALIFSAPPRNPQFFRVRVAPQ